MAPIEPACHSKIATCALFLPAGEGGGGARSYNLCCVLLISDAKKLLLTCYCLQYQCILGAVTVDVSFLIYNFSPEVTFCGYSVPHPSERKINLRIQTSGEAIGWMVDRCEHSDWSGVAAVEALRKGLEDLQEMCGHVLHTFKVY